MGQTWFVEGGTGTLRIAERDGGWYVDPADTKGETKCLIEGSVDADSTVAEPTVEVLNYRAGSGNSTNYLSVRIVDTDSPSDSPEDAGSDSDPVSGSASEEGLRDHDRGASGRPETRTLVSLDGSGDYVTVEATIDYIEFIEKGTHSMPDVRGVLREESSRKKRPFVVPDDVSHPYFEPGDRYRFVNAKDHLYEEEREVQVLITEATEFQEL